MDFVHGLWDALCRRLQPDPKRRYPEDVAITEELRRQTTPTFRKARRTLATGNLVEDVIRGTWPDDEPRKDGGR